MGNFPQAFSHVSLVNAAYNLSGHPDVEEQIVADPQLLLRRARRRWVRRASLTATLDPKTKVTKVPKSTRSRTEEDGAMKAITVVPGTANSIQLDDHAEPTLDQGSVLVDMLAVGICGTDLEIVAGDYGWSPPGQERLVLGHESIGRVREAPASPGFSAGTTSSASSVEPDPVPCYNCEAGEWDFCRNGQYTEHGIKSLDGFMRHQYRADPAALVKVDAGLGILGVLLEPTSVVAKAWEQAERVANAPTWHPKVAVVTGAGPIGLLAAMIGVQKGLEVHVFDQMTTGLKPDLVAASARSTTPAPSSSPSTAPTSSSSARGSRSLVFDAIEHVGSGGVVCLAGVSPVGKRAVASTPAWSTVRWCSRTKASSDR